MDKKGGVTSSRRSFFVPNRRKTSWENPSAFQKYSGIKSFYIIGESQFCHFFCLTSPTIIAGEPVCVSEFFSFQNFLDKRGITILSIVFVSQYQKTCGEPSIDSKSLGHPNNLCIIEEILGFPWKSFSLTVPKNFVGERFCLSEKFKYGKSSWIRRGVWRFSVEVFCPKMPKNIVGEHFCVPETFWYEKFLDNRSITIFLIFFVSHRQKSPWANTSVFQNYSCFKGFLVNTGITILSNCFCLTVLKNLWRTLQCSKNVRASKIFLNFNRGISRFSVENV